MNALVMTRLVSTRRESTPWRSMSRLTDPAPVAGHYPGPWQSDDAEPDAPLPRVSAHYVVDEAGQVYALVPEEHRAWHAGVSSWEGDGEVNHRSIGIEIVNGGHDFDLPEFPDAQIDAVISLLKDIFERWPQLNAKRVVAHSDIAPARKADPGEKFPWRRLADAGVAIWPEHVAVQLSMDDPISEVQQQLAFIGYPVTQTGYMDGAPRMSMQGFGVIVGTAPKIALHMNVNRGYLYLQNNSTDDLYVSFDVRPNPKTALVIGAGGYLEPRVCPTNAVWIMSATLDNAQVNIVEGVLR